jgi:hypothetical protein
VGSACSKVTKDANVTFLYLQIMAAGKGFSGKKNELICGPYTPRFLSCRKKFSICKYPAPLAGEICCKEFFWMNFKRGKNWDADRALT